MQLIIQCFIFLERLARLACLAFLNCLARLGRTSYSNYSKELNASKYSNISSRVGLMRLPLLLVLFFSTYTSLTNALPIPQEQVMEMPVSDRVLAVIRDVEAKRVEDLTALKRLTADISTNNDAERLLLLYAQGLVTLQHQEFKVSVNTLEKARELLKNIPKAMQISAPYYHLNQALSDAYVALDNYQQGYHYRRTYLIRFVEEFQRNEEAQLASLEEKYQIKQREQVNLLLAEQSKLKQLEVARIEQNKKEHERYAIVLFCVCIVFLLMIFRQLQIRKKLKWLAITDTLTGLSNRDHLFKIAREKVSQAQAEEQPLSVLVIDVDQLKRFNSEFGYAFGDALLQEVARLGREVMRSRDVFAHMEAEEFIAVLPDADNIAAQTIANNFMAKISARPLSVANESVKVTVSIGIASLGEQIQDVDTLIKAADDAMYLAKRSGSGQMASFNPTAQIITT